MPGIQVPINVKEPIVTCCSIAGKNQSITAVLSGGILPIIFLIG